MYEFTGLLLVAGLTTVIWFVWEIFGRWVGIFTLLFFIGSILEELT